MHQLLISGRLVSGGDSSEKMNMYRVQTMTPNTDGGQLEPHYEIAVADCDAQGGYRPILLIEQDYSWTRPIAVKGSARVNFDVFHSHSVLSEEALTSLHETGIYEDPHAKDMIAEVQELLQRAATEAAKKKDQKSSLQDPSHMANK